MELKLTEARARKDPESSSRRRPRVNIFVDPKGETILDNLVAGRRNRPYNEWKPLVKDFLVNALGLPEDIKLRWSKNTGCSMCPCSPGFMIDWTGNGDVAMPWQFERDWELYGRDVNVFLTIEADEYVAQNRQITDLVVGRDEVRTEVNEYMDDMDNFLAEVEQAVRG